MKVKFEVECTPDEVRQSLGLPDIGPLQQRMLSQMEAKMHENLRFLEPETLLKTWLPIPIQGWTDMQKMLWGQMGFNPSHKKEE
jgi:hypothetical protein